MKRSWKWLLASRHLKSQKSKPGVKWINSFAFWGLLLGVFAWTSLMSIMSGLQGETQKKIQSEKTHWVWEGAPLEGLAEKVDLLNSNPSLKKEYGILSAEVVLLTEGLLELPDRGENARTIGSGVVLEGLRNLSPGKIALGSELVDRLMLAQGETLYAYSAWDLKISPLVIQNWESLKTGYYDFDSTRIRMSAQDLQEWLGLGPVYSRVEIKLSEPDLVTDKQKLFLQEYFGLSFKSWKEVDAALLYSLKLEKFMMGFLVAFVFVLALIALYISMIVKMNERLRETALLSALGASSSSLEKVFLLEGGMLGFKGGLIGLGVSWVFCWAVSNFGQMPDIYYSRQIPVDWNWEINVGFLALSWLVCLLVSYLPSRRLRRVDVATVLRS